MGNSLATDIAGKNSLMKKTLLGDKVKEIMTDYKVDYLNTTVKLHLAKACCNGSVSNDKNNTNYISLAFPDVINVSGKSQLSTVYVGYQLNEDPSIACTEKNIGYNMVKRIGDSKQNTSCDAFMIDYCAKSLYDQGCIRTEKNKKGDNVFKLVKQTDNPSCWNADDKTQFNYGPPECHCLNSPFGVTLNSKPQRSGTNRWPAATNPFNLSIDQLDPDGYSKYTLNMYNVPIVQQVPTILDPRCTTRREDNSIMASAYILGKETNPSINICTNSINFNNSNIGEADFNRIQQKNNCGNNPLAHENDEKDETADVIDTSDSGGLTNKSGITNTGGSTVSGTKPTDATKPVDATKPADATKPDDAVAKKKADEENKKADDEKKLAAAKKVEDDKKAAETKKALDDAKKKADEDRKALEDTKKALDDAKKKAEEEANKSIITKATDFIKTINSIKLMSALFIIVIIIIILILVYQRSQNKKLQFNNNGYNGINNNGYNINNNNGYNGINNNGYNGINNNGYNINNNNGYNGINNNGYNGINNRN